MDRREFLKKAGVASGLGAAGALTLKKDYVKPVVRMLEPSYAEAVTPVLSVTVDQPAGSTFVSAGAGGTFTVGVWSIDVPLSAAIPAGLDVSCKVNYVFQSSGGVGGAIPAGTGSTNFTGFQTSAGELRLAQVVARWPSMVDGEANAVSLSLGDNATGNSLISNAMAQMATSTEGNDAFMLGYTPTIAATSILGVNIPTTAISKVNALYKGA